MMVMMKSVYDMVIIYNTHKQKTLSLYLWMKWMTWLWPSAILLKLQSVALQRLIMCSEVKADIYTNTHVKPPHSKQADVFSLWKDINDLNGLHGNWRSGTTVTFILNNHHEQVTAGNLLNHKRPEWENTENKKRVHSNSKSISYLSDDKSRLSYFFKVWKPHINVQYISTHQN